MKLEYKLIPLSLKDVDTQHRTAVIAHCVYDNVDRTKDISRKGMFNKSWQEIKSDINFYFNHDDTQAPGLVKNVFEDDQKAYTEVKLGTHTLGEDVLKMMSEGVARHASFGYSTVRANNIEVKGEKVRELKQVWHYETSVLTKMPANPKAGVVNVYKSWAQSDLADFKQHLYNLENFCRNTTASDECIIDMLDEIKSINSILSEVDTADTHDGAQSVSEKVKDEQTRAIRLAIIHSKLNVA